VNQVHAENGAKVQRREFIKQSAATFAAASMPRSASLHQAVARVWRKPNVVFVLCDQWRGQALGYAGDINAHTPTLDRLARESINFTQAISSLPLCCPGRASLMTGQYPLTNGVFINDVPLQPKAVTLGEAFKRAGYRTGYIGKWHLFGSPDGHYGRRAAYIPPDHRFGFDYWKANECEHDYNHSRYYAGNDETPRYWPGYDAIAETEDACRFIQANAKAPEPFFLFLSMGPPHFPYNTAPEQYRGLYSSRELQSRSNIPSEKVKDATNNLRGYYSHIAALDDCIKQVVATLDRVSLAEDTILVFASDHGDMLESQGLFGKLFPWDESVRIPFLLRYPRKLGSGGKVLEAPLNIPDIMPTLLGLCEIPLPEGLQGTDYSKLISGQNAADLPRSAFINNPVSTFQLRQCGFDSYRGVRTKQYTYIRSIHGPWLLYDNIKDPFQMHNLCGEPDPDVGAIQIELDQEIDFWLTRLGDRFLPGEEYLRQAGLDYYFETKTPIGYYSSPWGDWGPTMF
jgi:arylsulfatase A-like enzyme